MQSRRAQINDVSNPESLIVHIFPGADGAFELREDLDQAEDRPENWARTRLSLDWKGASFTVGAVQGAVQAVPEKRTWALRFRNVFQTSVDVQGAEAEVSYDEEERTLQVTLKEVLVTQAVTVRFPEGLGRTANPLEELAESMLRHAQIGYPEKQKLYDTIVRYGSKAVGTVAAAAENKTVKGALLELLSADLEE